VHLGRDHRAIALRVVLEKSPQNLFARASRIDVSRVEEVDTKIESLLEKWLRISLIQCLGMAARGQSPFGRLAIRHAAKTNA
jgi:hypothetical protein